MNSVKRIDHAERVREFYRRQGKKCEQERILSLLQDFFELGFIDKSKPNLEWDRGFQAAIALIRSNK